jgi:hypothetical protein
MDISIEANLSYIFGVMVRKLTKYWGKTDISSQEKSCMRYEKVAKAQKNTHPPGGSVPEIFLPTPPCFYQKFFEGL